ncbi:HTH-type transcriptional repressor GlcR [bioreactor metagenome]|uniref:HTH-type transcriptional repressor GlcR n=1 Tax=bioreactor metagenome TaxID=1076179 RepID=A0A644XQT9_9ZZZZ|nr:DeoR/GlpR family DNA-binding transcription regulator [Oscillibacter sp.]
MFQTERQGKILDYVNSHKKVRTKDLSKVFRTSVVTIRADIDELDAKGLIVRVHGGAMALSDRFNLEIPSQSKARQNIDSKRAIGKLAANMIEENDIIILDSGSTTLEIAKAMPNIPVTVITNDLKVGLTLASSKRNVTLIMTGGKVEASVYTISGIEVVDFINHIKVNKLFLGCDAIDEVEGISNRTMSEARVKQAMIDVAVSVIAVADSSKISKEVFFHVCDLNKINTFVTDKIADKKRELFEAAGVSVIVPEDNRK